MLNKKILLELEEYMAVNQSLDFTLQIDEITLYSEKSIMEDLQNTEFEEFLQHHKKPSFKEILFSFIDENGASDAEIYKKAWIDRKHFSKIRSNPDYRPKKKTVLALAFALELDEQDTDILLNAAGYSLSGSETFDLVILFCLEKRIYNIAEVNEALEHIGLNPLIC